MRAISAASKPAWLYPRSRRREGCIGTGVIQLPAQRRYQIGRDWMPGEVLRHHATQLRCSGAYAFVFERVYGPANDAGVTEWRADAVEVTRGFGAPPAQ